MNQESQVVEEIQKMITLNLVPISVQEDIHELCDQIINGEATLSDLKHDDPFVAEVVEKAIGRIK